MRAARNIEPMSMGHLAKIKARIEQDMNVRIEFLGCEFSPWCVTGWQMVEIAPSRHCLERMRSYASTSLIFHLICLFKYCIHMWMAQHPRVRLDARSARIWSKDNDHDKVGIGMNMGSRVSPGDQRGSKFLLWLWRVRAWTNFSAYWRFMACKLTWVNSWQGTILVSCCLFQAIDAKEKIEEECLGTAALRLFKLEGLWHWSACDMNI